MKIRKPKAAKAGTFPSADAWTDKAPTPEQMRKGEYEIEEIFDHLKSGRKITIGKAYRRKPWFETMYRRRLVTADELRALRHYRRAFDQSDGSEMRCALDVKEGGGGSSPSMRLPTLAQAIGRDTLRACEAGIGAVLLTLRQVALLDHTLADIAISRFGAARYEARGKTRARVQPRARHALLVQAEWEAGLRLLVANVAPMIETK